MSNNLDISVFVGMTFTSIEQTENGGEDQLRFNNDKGEQYVMFHSRDCCEGVSIDDIVGELDDLIGTPILTAYETTNRQDNPKDKWDESFTWTFYNIATIKGSVTIKWYGSSNGYYSESVQIGKNYNGKYDSYANEDWNN